MVRRPKITQRPWDFKTLKICPRIFFGIGFVYGAMEFVNENVMHWGIKVDSIMQP